MEKRVVFQHRYLPYLLVFPQILITLVFFIWPAAQALYQSFLQEDAFGLSRSFVGLKNFVYLFNDKTYLSSLWVTVVFSLSVTGISMAASLLLAALADRVVRGATGYKTLLIWPYAVAPAVAGVLWFFLFNPTVGLLPQMLKSFWITWDHALNGRQAMILVIMAATWRQISYNFLFFLAGLQSIPKSLVEAAAMDGAGPFKRFRTIVLPLLSPTSFFLIIVNVVYAFFDTFGVIHTITGGGPNHATDIMVFKVYHDGFLSLDLGGSAAQSVILMGVVMGLTILQFRYIERAVHY